MRFALLAIMLCVVCARGTADPLLPGMLHPAYRDWVTRPGEMYGFWLWWGPGSASDPVARTGANATSMHLMMHPEQDPDAPDGVRVAPGSVEDPSLDALAGVGVGLGEHNNPFFVGYPDWFWQFHQEARMKDRDGKTIRVGNNPVPAMLNPLLTRLARAQMADMVRLLSDKSWARYWVIGGEQSWPDYFGLPEGDHSPAMRRHFTARKSRLWEGSPERDRRQESPPTSVSSPTGVASHDSTRREKDAWRDFRDSVVVDRFAGYTAHLHKLDPTRPAMVPTHGNPFALDFRGKLGYPIADLAGVVDGFEAGPISLDDDAERIIRMTLDQQTSFGVPVVAPRLANKQLDPAARGGGRTFTPASLRRTVYEALGLGVWHIGLVQWVGDLPDGEWGIADRPAEAEAKRIFAELRMAGPYLDGCFRLQPRVGIFISDATWSRWWQDRWTLLYDEAIKRGWSVVLLTDAQIDAHLASETPVLISVDNVTLAPQTRDRLAEYMRAGGKLVSVPDAESPAVKVIHQTQTTTGANTWSFDVKPLALDAVEAAAGADLRPVIVLENGKRAEGIEPLLLTDGTNVQVVLINRSNECRSVRLSSDSVGQVRQVRDLVTGKLLDADITIDPLGTALVSLEPAITAETAESEVSKAESAVIRWTKLGADTGCSTPLLTRAQAHMKAGRPSKAYALARSITQGLALRTSVDVSDGLKAEVRVWDAEGRPAKNAQVRLRLVPGRFVWYGLKETSPGVYRLDLSRKDLPLFYNPSTEKHDLANGATSAIVDASHHGRHGGMRAMVVFR